MSAPMDVLAALCALSRNIRSRAGRINVPQMPVSDADAVDMIHDAVAELIAACKERDAANAAWNHLEGDRRQSPGPEYQRARSADDRYASALARVGGAS